MTAPDYCKVLLHVYVPSRLGVDVFVEDYNHALDFYDQFADEYGEAHLHEECYRTQAEYEAGEPSGEECLQRTDSGVAV